jgi:hypothetical protein
MAIVMAGGTGCALTVVVVSSSKLVASEGVPARKEKIFPGWLLEART